MPSYSAVQWPRWDTPGPIFNDALRAISRSLIKVRPTSSLNPSIREITKLATHRAASRIIREIALLNRSLRPSGTARGV